MSEDCARRGATGRANAALSEDFVLRGDAWRGAKEDVDIFSDFFGRDAPEDLVRRGDDGDTGTLEEGSSLVFVDLTDTPRDSKCGAREDVLEEW